MFGRRFSLFVIAAMLIAAIGCSGPKPAATVVTNEDKPVEVAGSATVVPPVDDADRLYQQLRAGAYQLNAALDAMETALAANRKLAGKAGDVGAAAKDIEEILNSAGSTAGDYTEPPTLEQVRKEFAAQDDYRLKAVDDLNDARLEVIEAAGSVDSLLDGGGGPDAADLNALADAIDEVVDVLKAAIEALGGTATEPREEES